MGPEGVKDRLLLLNLRKTPKKSLLRLRHLLKNQPVAKRKRNQKRLKLQQRSKPQLKNPLGVKGGRLSPKELKTRKPLLKRLPPVVPKRQKVLSRLRHPLKNQPVVKERLLK